MRKKRKILLERERILFCQKRDTWNGPKNVTIVTLPFILRIFLKDIKKIVVIKEKH